MTSDERKGLASWAQFRFSIIGGLLARPPEKGELKRELARLASQSYQHPTEDKRITFSFSTIERWYYKALGSDDPLSSLGRKMRQDAGTHKVMNCALVGSRSLLFNGIKKDAILWLDKSQDQNRTPNHRAD